MLFIIFPVVHQPSSGERCDDEDSWCSECAGREGRTAGVMEGRGVAVAWLTGGATLLGGVTCDDVGLPSFLQGGAEELRGMAEGIVGTSAVLPGKAKEDMSVAEGTKGLASTLRADPTANVGG